MALGLLILVAGGLKAFQLATEPVLGAGLLASRWFLMGTVEFELFFGVWLLAGLLPRATRYCAIACFSVFAVVSLARALSGAASCGCFGRVAVRPWYTFALDVAAVLALLRWAPPRLDWPRGDPAQPWIARAAVVLGLWFALGASAAAAMSQFQAATLALEDAIVGDGNVVVIEPQAWRGNRLPLLPYIDVGDRLARGEWLVLLYHHDCPECRAAIKQLSESVQRGDASRVALIELPPFGGSDSRNGFGQNAPLYGRVAPSHNWFARTPAFLTLKNGRVMRVFEDKGPDLRRTITQGAL